MGPALLLAALQAVIELKPQAQKFDRLALAFRGQTDIKSSNGRDSRYTFEMDCTAEVDKAEGGSVTYDCGVARLKIAGTHDGKPVDFEWNKDGTERGGKIAGLAEALKKGWKITATPGKGFTVSEAAGALGDLVPNFNPGSFVGLPVALPAGPVAIGKGWEVKGPAVPYFNGFGLACKASLNQVGKDVARLSGRLLLTSPESEVPIEGALQVKGDGYASLEFDLKSGRPVKGAHTVKLTSQQGGLRREVSQTLEFEVR